MDSSVSNGVCVPENDSGEEEDDDNDGEDGGVINDGLSGP